MNRNCDIICLTVSRWDTPISSLSLSLCREFARTNRVFYIDHPFSWKDYFLERSTAPVQRRKKALLNDSDIYYRPFSHLNNFISVTAPLMIPVNFLPEGRLYDQFSVVNNRKLIRLLKRLIKDHGIKDFIFINFFDPYFLGNLPAELQPLRYIYYCMDDIAEVAYSRRHGVRLEENIIRRADLCFCTSPELREIKSALSSSIFYLPNGADIQLFKTAVNENLPEPSDLSTSYEKIIGFIGSIDYRSDFGLLERIAVSYPRYLLFLIGPVYATKKETAILRNMPNIVFAGPKPQHELPRYLQRMHCMIIPYKKNKLAKSIYPLKINEYLAAGKPVVTTDFSGSVESFSSVVYLALSGDDFINKIEEAIADDNEELRKKRVETVEGNSWENRAAQFWNTVMDS